MMAVTAANVDHDMVEGMAEVTVVAGAAGIEDLGMAAADAGVTVARVTAAADAIAVIVHLDLTIKGTTKSRRTSFASKVAVDLQSRLFCDQQRLRRMAIATPMTPAPSAAAGSGTSVFRFPAHPLS